MLFLIACGGYLLGLGSAIVLQRVEKEEATLAAEPLPTSEPTATTIVVAAIPSPPTSTPRPSATPAPPTAEPTRTPFTGPEIAEPPAVPRQLPAAPVVVAPVAPRVAPTEARPRNLETSKPEPPAASVLTPTPGLVRTVRPTAVAVVGQATPLATQRPAGLSTPLPTLALPATRPTPSAPTPGPTSAAPAPTRPPTAPPTPTPGKTPPVR